MKYCALYSRKEAVPPQEVKISGVGLKGRKTIDENFLRDLFKVLHPDSTLTFIGLPLAVLCSALRVLYRQKFLRSVINFEIDIQFDSRRLGKVLPKLKNFSKEALYYQVLPRVKLVFLVNLGLNGATNIERFIRLKDYLSKKGIGAVPLINYRGAATLPVIERTANNLLEFNEPLLVYSASFSVALFDLFLRCRGLFTFHDALNRILYRLRNGDLLEIGSKAGDQQLFVHADGGVYSCYGAYLAKRRIGNWQRESFVNLIAKPSLRATPGKCRQCRQFFFCQGCVYIPPAASAKICLSRFKTKYR